MVGGDTRPLAEQFPFPESTPPPTLKQTCRRISAATRMAAPPGLGATLQTPLCGGRSAVSPSVVSWAIGRSMARHARGLQGARACWSGKSGDQREWASSPLPPSHLHFLVTQAAAHSRYAFLPARGTVPFRKASPAISVHVPFSEHLRALLFPARQQLATVTIMLQDPQHRNHHKSSGAYTNKHLFLMCLRVGWGGTAHAPVGP